jgi:hypothetical protein
MNAKEYLIRKSGRKFGTLKQEWRFQTLDQLVEYLDEYHQAKLKEELPTEGEINQRAVAVANQGEFKSNFPHDWHSVHEGFMDGAKWVTNLLKGER